MPASIRKLEAETDRHIGALGDRKMKKKTEKNRPSPCSTQNVLKSATVHNEGSLTHARCRPACRAREQRRRCGHQGRIFHTSNTLDSQTFAYNCFGKTSKKTHTMTFLCLQLYSFIKRKQEVPPQQRLLRAADLFAYVIVIQSSMRVDQARLGLYTVIFFTSFAWSSVTSQCQFFFYDKICKTPSFPNRSSTITRCCETRPMHMGWKGN